MRSSHAPAVLIIICGSAFSAQPPGPAAAPVQPAAAQAQQAAAALPMRRMFFTPAERAALDESRRRPAIVAAAEPKPLPPAPEFVTLDGVVRRSDGTTTVWLNNRLLEGKRTAEGLEVTNSRRTPGTGNVTVRVPQAGRSVDMRVGQQLDVTSGKVQERYQLAPPAPAPASETADTTETSAAKPGVRRPAKEREMLRELLREIDAPAANRPEPPAAGNG